MPKVAMLNTKILKYKLFENELKKVYTIVYTFYFFA